MPGFSSWGVFLSYRRDDTGPYARLLQLQLSQRLPHARIFMDKDSIEPGRKFAADIEDAVNSCAILVALIGRQWATLTDRDGARRLDNPDDYVRFEVKTALERGALVIPVLVDGAKALRQQELPADLRKLAHLNAYKLSWERHDDADRLLDLIEQELGKASGEARASHSGQVKARDRGDRDAQAAQDRSSQAQRVLVWQTREPQGPAPGRDTPWLVVAHIDNRSEEPVTQVTFRFRGAGIRDGRDRPEPLDAGEQAIGTMRAYAEVNATVYFRDVKGVLWRRDAASGELEAVPPGDKIPARTGAR